MRTEAYSIYIYRNHCAKTTREMIFYPLQQPLYQTFHKFEPQNTPNIIVKTLTF